MVIDQQVAFYHEARKEYLTGTVVGSEGKLYKISYRDGKTNLVALVKVKLIIPFA